MLMGSVGWIAAGLLIGEMHLEYSADQFRLAALAAGAMGFYCLTLPHTPPLVSRASASLGELLGLDALKLLRVRSFAVFMAGSFLICVPLSFYFSWTNVFLNELGVPEPASKMTLGQASDVTFLFLMPFFFRLLRVKGIMLLGMLAWTVRFALFGLYASGTPWMGFLYTGILLHGMCYDFCFVMGRIYVDRRAPEHLRATAQGLLAFTTLGVGMFVGSWLSGVVGERYSHLSDAGVTTHDWQHIWLIPAGMSAVVFIAFALLFKEDDPVD